MDIAGEKVKAAGAFLLQAPLGEYDEVRKAVAKLLDNDELLKRAYEVLPAHFESLCAPIATGKKPSYILLSETARIGDGVYACARSGNAYTVDYGRKAVSNCRELTDDEKATIGLDDELRISIEKAMFNYVDEHHEKYGKYTVIKSGDSYHISVHSDRYRAENYWSGTWVAKAGLEPAEDEWNLNLETIVSVHYFEDGNVQMNSARKDVVKIAQGEADKVAGDVVAALNKFLADYHSAVSSYYVKMQDSTFKVMRRQLPVTKTKIDWDKLHSYNLAMESALDRVRSNANN